jgi:hypothetical protein
MAEVESSFTLDRVQEAGARSPRHLDRDRSRLEVRAAGRT